MISFSEFLQRTNRLDEVQITKISSLHSSRINPNPNLQKTLNRAVRSHAPSANELAYLSKSLLTQSLHTARRLKSLSASQQTEVMIELTAVTAALARLFALYVQSEK